MSAIIAIILDNWQAVTGAFGVLAAFVFGRKSANEKHKARKAKADEKTHDRINEIEPVDPNDPSDIERRLRKHSE